jgi:thymidylate synthase ThyX
MPEENSGPDFPRQRVLTVAPMPPEKLAYALARYSRSPDSIRDSMTWVRNHDSAKFLESFYFQYGHASIADLGHLTVCFEGISELAATEIEDEQLWDGQARSSRYQDFSNSGLIVPPELTADEIAVYSQAGEQLLASYQTLHRQAVAYLKEHLQQPADMKPEPYARNIAARAFDIARYLLPLGIPTGVGQVTSIRTLERQIRRLKASEFQEVREIGDELGKACARPPDCHGCDREEQLEPLAPTLARHAGKDEHATRLRADLAEWARDHVHDRPSPNQPRVDLLQPVDATADICATLLYTVTEQPYRVLYDVARGWPETRRKDLLHLALGSRQRGDDYPRHLRNAPYVFDIVMDIGAYRDLHRHRRCQQFRQQYTSRLGFEMPELLSRFGAEAAFSETLELVRSAVAQLPQPAAQYLLPFAARSRFLFKMDFAELAYISKLRSGVKGHISYRKVAWDMKLALEKLDPVLGEFVEATPPWIEDPLKR